MTIRLYSIFLAALLVATTACNNDKNNDDQDSSCTYCACCDTAPLSDAFQAGGAIAQVYIPNMIVSGSSEVANKSFAVFANAQIAQIAEVKILDPNGNSLFGGAGLPVNTPLWDGQSTDISSPGNYTGSFEYIVTVKAVDGQAKTYTGSGCVIECGNTSDFQQSNLPKCGFPVQNNNGAFGGGNPAVVQECF